MQNVPNESVINLDQSSSATTNDFHDKFNREIRLNKNSCPLCHFVQDEISKGNQIPIEEWIFLTHLKNVHGIEP